MAKEEKMTLNKLIKALTGLRRKMKNGEYEIEFYLKDGEEEIFLELESIGHFNIYPTSNIAFIKESNDKV